MDPGSVNTEIYRNSSIGHGPLRAVREFFCSPPAEGAAAVVHAATGAALPVHLVLFTSTYLVHRPKRAAAVSTRSHRDAYIAQPTGVPATALHGVAAALNLIAVL